MCKERQTRRSNINLYPSEIKDIERLQSYEHIVKVKTKRRVNLINLSLGYKEIEIISPPEL